LYCSSSLILLVVVDPFENCGVLCFFFLVLVSSFRLVLSHGSRFEVSLIAEEQPAHGAAAAAPGGRLQAVHAFTVLGVPQPVGQVLRESSILTPPPPPFVFRRARRLFDGMPDSEGPPCFGRATGLSPTGRRWTWTWRTTC
jgi:hypothetical protein